MEPTLVLEKTAAEVALEVVAEELERVTRERDLAVAQAEFLQTQRY
jgi:hypothetical protein